MPMIASPHGTALDEHGNLFIADLKNDRVRRVDPSNGIITTVAGNGEHGYSGDGGPATEAMLASPIAVNVSADGDLYIADHRNSRIRVVEAATGIITTVAGTGEQGFSGDGGPAVQAAISLPRDVALDADGSLYIADGANNRIRKVDSNGTITTVVGTGRTEFSDDGDPAHKASLSMPLQHRTGPCRQPVHRRHRQLSRPQNRRIDGHHRDRSRERIIRLLRRRRPRHRRHPRRWQETELAAGLPVLIVYNMLSHAERPLLR